ncbi:MAG: hypothetical protein JO080_07275 [Mucilaginibacter sp.]|nr:hypothetical protein [Mucilaginibacter sp.]
METIFVSTHLIMLICIAGIVYMSVSSKNNGLREGKKSDYHLPAISKSLQAMAAAFCKVAFTSPIVFVK